MHIAHHQNIRVLKDIVVHLEHGAQLGDQGHASRPEVLPDGDLLEEDGHAAEGHGHGVHEQEGACKRRRFISLPGLVHWATCLESIWIGF